MTDGSTIEKGATTSYPGIVRASIVSQHRGKYLPSMVASMVMKLAEPRASVWVEQWDFGMVRWLDP